VLGGNWILTPGSLLACCVGGSITPNNFAVPKAKPALIILVASVATKPVIPIAPTIAVAIAVNTAIYTPSYI
jgi:hypothetical protein